MVLTHSEASADQAFLDSGQYTREAILKYELVYGANLSARVASAARTG